MVSPRKRAGTAAPAGWHIDSMRLRLTGLSASDSHWVGQEVARRLALMPGPPRKVAALDLKLPNAAGRTREELARLILKRIAGALR